MPGRDSDNSLLSSDEEDYTPSDFGMRNFKNLDPGLQHEISWSVSQLRAIFGDSLKGAKVHPPPYRPPPSLKSYMVADSYRKRTQYGEESYV